MSLQFGFYISITYFAIYGLVFICASIYSAYEVHVKSSQVSVSTSAIQNKMKNKNGTKQFLKDWIKMVWIKKSIYISIIPHLFDQATDIGVVYTYYKLWRDNVNSDPTINFQALFAGSIVVIIAHKIVSCSVIYSLTGSFRDIFLQFLDLMMVKAVYLNYKLQTNEPGNAQRILQLIEGTFESGPQVFISFLFIIKANQTEPLVLISAVSSIWTIASRVKSDDKGFVEEEWRDHEFNYKSCPPFNPRYMFRTIGRLVEISNRILILSLIWTSVGGLGLIVILMIEFFAALLLCVWTQDFMVLANLMYCSVPDYLNQNVPNYILDAFMIYRMCSPVFYSLLVTLFVTINFEAWKVEDYPIRHEFVIQQPLGLSLLILGWITSVGNICFLVIMFLYGFDGTATGRKFDRMIEREDWEEALNLIAFGLSKNKLLFVNSDGSIMHYLLRCKDETFINSSLFKQMCEVVLDADTKQDVWSIVDVNGICPMEVLAKRSGWDTIIYFIDLGVSSNSLIFTKNNTILHHLFRKCDDQESFRRIFQFVFEKYIYNNDQYHTGQNDNNSDIEYWSNIWSYRDYSNMFAIELAARNQRWEDIIYCIAYGVPKNVLLFDSNQGTILHYLFQNCDDKQLFDSVSKIVLVAEEEYVDEEVQHSIWDKSCNKNVPMSLLAQNGEWEKILYFINLGVSTSKLLYHGLKGTILHHLFDNCKDEQIFQQISAMVVTADNDQRMWKKTDETGTMPMVLLAKYSEWDKIKYFINLGVSKQVLLFDTPEGMLLHYLFQNCENDAKLVEIVELVIHVEESDELWTRKRSGSFPIQILAERGEWKHILNFINLNIPNKSLLFYSEEYGTLLHYLFETCDDFELLMKICTKILNCDENEYVWNQQNQYNETAIVIAARYGRWKEIIKCFELGLSTQLINFYVTTGTVLHFLFTTCCDYNLFTAVCKIILKLDLDPNIWSKTNASGNSWIEYSNIDQKEALNRVKYLVTQCKVDVKYTVKYMLLNNSENKFTDILAYLIENTDIDVQSMDVNLDESMYQDTQARGGRIVATLKAASACNMTHKNFRKHKIQNMQAMASILNGEQYPKEAINILRGMFKCSECRKYGGGHIQSLTNTFYCHNCWNWHVAYMRWNDERQKSILIDIFDSRDEQDENKFQRKFNDIHILTLKQGCGSKPNYMSLVEIEFTGYSNGTQYAKKSKAVDLARNNFVQGLQQAIIQITVGSIVKVWVPYALVFIEDKPEPEILPNPHGEIYKLKLINNAWPDTTKNEIDMLTLIEGSGTVPSIGSIVDIEYTRFFEHKNEPFHNRKMIQLKAEEKIKGMHQALLRTKVGSRFKLWIPSQLVYGAETALSYTKSAATYEIILHSIVPQDKIDNLSVYMDNKGYMDDNKMDELDDASNIELEDKQISTAL